MTVNAVLAVVPVILVILLKKNFPHFIKMILYVFWFLFLPNTIYLVTDLQYFPKQFLDAFGIVQFILIVQYLFLTVLGIWTYFYALQPYKEILKSWKIKEKGYNLFYAILNFIIAYAVILGKIERTESWDIFLNPAKVIHDIMFLNSKPIQLTYVVIVGVIINIIYFKFHKTAPLIITPKRTSRR